MNDEIDGRMWNAHHEAFGLWVEDVIGALRRLFGRLASWDGSTAHLTSLVLSIGITAFTFRNTAL